MRRNVDLLAIALVLLMIAIASEARRANSYVNTRAQLVEFATQHAVPFTSAFDLPTLCVTRD